MQVSLGQRKVATLNGKSCHGLATGVQDSLLTAGVGSECLHRLQWRGQRQIITRPQLRLNHRHDNSGDADSQKDRPF